MAEEKQRFNGWKLTAIIFIVLFILQIVSLFAYFKWAWDSINEDYEKESDCIYNVCSSAETYLYDEYTSVCECYVDGELVNSKYMN